MAAVLPSEEQDRLLKEREASLARVEINLKTKGEKAISEVLVTLRDAQNRSILAQSKFTGNNFYFYQTPGKYIITIEVPGYRIIEQEISLQLGKTELGVQLKPTLVPLTLQRVLVSPMKVDSVIKEGPKNEGNN